MGNPCASGSCRTCRGGVFVAAGAQFGDPGRGWSALGAAQLAAPRRPFVVVGGAAFLVFAVDTAEGPEGAVVGVGRDGARGRALIFSVSTATTYTVQFLALGAGNTAADIEEVRGNLSAAMRSSNLKNFLICVVETAGPSKIA